VYSKTDCKNFRQKKGWDIFVCPCGIKNNSFERFFLLKSIPLLFKCKSDLKKLHFKMNVQRFADLIHKQLYGAIRD